MPLRRALAQAGAGTHNRQVVRNVRFLFTEGAKEVEEVEEDLGVEPQSPPPPPPPPGPQDSPKKVVVPTKGQNAVTKALSKVGKRWEEGGFKEA